MSDSRGKKKEVETSSIPEMGDVFEAVLKEAELEAVQSDIKHLQDLPSQKDGWWHWISSWIWPKSSIVNAVPDDWTPEHICNLLISCQPHELPRLTTGLLHGDAEICLTRVMFVFRYLGKLPGDSAKQARSHIFMRFPFERHPTYEAYLIQELHTETEEARQELKDCFNMLSPLKRLALVRLLDDGQLECLLPDIESLLSALDRTIRQLWLRGIGARQADQFLDRLECLWQRRQDLLESILIDMPDDTLDHFLVTAQRRFRITSLGELDRQEMDGGLHDLAFRILSRQVLERLDQGQMEHEDALAILGKIPIDHLEKTMLHLSGEMGYLSQHLKNLHHSLKKGNYVFHHVDTEALDERLQRIRSKVEAAPLPKPHVDSSVKGEGLAQHKVVPLDKSRIRKKKPKKKQRPES